MLKRVILRKLVLLMIWRNIVLFFVIGIVDLEKKIIDGKGKLRGNKGVVFFNIRKIWVK